MKVEQLDLKNETIENDNGLEKRMNHLEAALRELFLLLEEYAPTWYTEEHHNHAAAALSADDWRPRAKSKRANGLQRD